MDLQRPYPGNNSISNQNYGQPVNQNYFNPNGVPFNSFNQQVPDYNSLPSASLHQRLNDGSQRSQSPATAQNPAYNVNPVIPAKRSRVGEEEIDRNMSPKTMPGQFNSSRSQTPSHPGFASSMSGMSNGQHPNAYQHLQNATSNGASPSPLAQTQPFAQHGRPPTSNAQSPHPNQNPSGPSGMNPATSGRNLGQQAMNMGGQFGRAGNSGQQLPRPQQSSVQEAQQNYRLQLERQQRQLNAAHPEAQNRTNMSSMSPITNSNTGNAAAKISSGVSTTGQMPLNRQMMQGQNQGPQQQQKSSEETFLQSVTNYLSSRGQSLEPNPQICGRHVSYHQLFMAVNSSGLLNPGGESSDSWSLVAAKLGVTPAQFPSAPEEAKTLFNRNLMGFVREWMSTVFKRKQQQNQQMMQQNQQNQSQQGHQTNQGSVRPGGQLPPSAAAQSLGRSQSGLMQGQGQQSSQQHGVSGQQTHSMAQGSPPTRHMNMPGKAHSPSVVGLSRQASLEQPPGQLENLKQSSSRATSRGQDMDGQVMVTPDRNSAAKKTRNMGSSPSAAPTQQELEHYHPRKRVFPANADNDHGGLAIDAIARLGEDLARAKPGVPELIEMGAIDLHALTMSVQSGIHGEMRYALDQLVGISNDPRLPFDLSDCDELLDALYDCADDQLEYLMDHCSAPANHVQFPKFEGLVAKALKESRDLLVTPPFASIDHELEHAADRLIAVSTILRNFSIPDSKNNHDALIKPSSKTFIAAAIRKVGTRPNVLRTNRNLMDFMKDMVTLLSNISHRIELGTQDDASTILHFLLAFSPIDSPSLNDQEQLTFQTYDPKRHQYLPSAVDSLAKLFAVKYYPNRSFFKDIFSEDRAVGPESMLLTRVFALAIAPVPDRLSPAVIPERGDMVRLAQERNPFLSQGMLAGDLLTTLLQSGDEKLARDWLSSADGWAPSLMELLMRLPLERDLTHRRDHQGRIVDFEAGGCSVIAQRGLSMLRRLNEKVEKLDDQVFGVQPNREKVLGAACSNSFEAGSLKHLLAFAGFDA